MDFDWTGKLLMSVPIIMIVVCIVLGIALTHSVATGEYQKAWEERNKPQQVEVTIHVDND